MLDKIEAISTLGRGNDSGRGPLDRFWNFYFAYRPAVVLTLVLYLLLIHLAALGLLWRSEWPGVIAWNLGLGPKWMELDRFFGNHTGPLRHRAAAVAPGAVLFIGDSQLAALDAGALADHAVQLSIPGDTTRRV